MQYVFEIAYNGTAYHGWQVQQNAHTVQAGLNHAIQSFLQKEVETIGSGRTDTGVHAEQQFVQLKSPVFESLLDLEPANFLFRLNAILPKDIAVKRLYLATDDFSVRHDALKRSYEYRISREKNPFLNNLCCFYFQRTLDLDLMNKAAEILIQHDDFQSFSKYHSSVDHFKCNISEARWEEQNGLLIFNITANRFLRGMVRTIVGTLLEIGQKKISIMELEEILAKRDRKAAKHAVPAEGLFLTKVMYKEGALQLLT